MDIDVSTDVLESTAGLIFIGKIFKKIGMVGSKSCLRKFKGSSAIKTMAGLLVQRRTKFEESRLFQNSSLFSKILELKKVPAPETVRLYLEKLSETCAGKLMAALRRINIRLLKRVTLTSLDTGVQKYIPVDVDVSPLDNSGSHKEGVSRTYKGHDGYAPIFSYIGREGYMLDNELRPGKQHCQKGTVGYLRRTLKTAHKLNLDESLLVRLDSGNDSLDTLKVLIQSGDYFLFKRNLRREAVGKYISAAISLGDCEIPREGKEVYTATLTGCHPQAEKLEGLAEIDQVIRVTIRRIDRDGNHILFPEEEADIEVYCTNLPEDPKTVIDLYHDHGTSEQFHSELKNDMNVERLPSGKLAVNEIILQIAMICFNTLRLIGQTALLYKENLPYRHRGMENAWVRLSTILSEYPVRLSVMQEKPFSKYGSMIPG